MMRYGKGLSKALGVFLGFTLIFAAPLSYAADPTVYQTSEDEIPLPEELTQSFRATKCQTDTDCSFGEICTVGGDCRKSCGRCPDGSKRLFKPDGSCGECTTKCPPNSSKIGNDPDCWCNHEIYNPDTRSLEKVRAVDVGVCPSAAAIAPNCSEEATWDPILNRCITETEEDGNCPPGSVIEDGVCVSEVTCDEGYELNENTGNCVPVGCPDGYEMNTSGECVEVEIEEATPDICPPGRIQTESGDCLCPEGTVQAADGSAAGECVPEDQECEEGFVYSDGQCVAIGEDCSDPESSCFDCALNPDAAECIEYNFQCKITETETESCSTPTLECPGGERTVTITREGVMAAYDGNAIAYETQEPCSEPSTVTVLGCCQSGEGASDDVCGSNAIEVPTGDTTAAKAACGNSGCYEIVETVGTTDCVTCSSSSMTVTQSASCSGNATPQESTCACYWEATPKIVTETCSSGQLAASTPDTEETPMYCCASGAESISTNTCYDGQVRNSGECTGDGRYTAISSPTCGGALSGPPGDGDYGSVVVAGGAFYADCAVEAC